MNSITPSPPDASEIWHYVQPIPRGVLPKELKFDGRFNEPIARGVLPQTLVDLKFGGLFNPSRVVCYHRPC